MSTSERGDWPVSTGTTGGSVPTLVFDHRGRRDFWTRSLVVGGAILVWMAILGALASFAVGIWVGVDLGSGSSSRTYTDERGNACALADTSAVPELLCPESLSP